MKMHKSIVALAIVGCLTVVGCSAPGQRSERSSSAEEQQAEGSPKKQDGDTGPKSDSTADMLDEENETDKPGNGAGEDSSAGATDNNDDSRRVREVRFGESQQTIVETLAQMQEKLDEQREKVKEAESEATELRGEMKEAKNKRDDLEQQLEEREAHIEELEDSVAEWKDNVIGFRDEMRESEKAQMEALKEIIFLLREATNDEETDDE